MKPAPILGVATPIDVTTVRPSDSASGMFISLCSPSSRSPGNFNSRPAQPLWIHRVIACRAVSRHLLHFFLSPSRSRPRLQSKILMHPPRHASPLTLMITSFSSVNLHHSRNNIKEYSDSESCYPISSRIFLTHK